MKKYPIFSIAFAIMSFVGVVNVSAASINSQSIDVTVGEVDKISTDDENQDANAPDTGSFGLETSGASIAIATFIPTIIILTYIFRRIHHKRAK